MMLRRRLFAAGSLLLLGTGARAQTTPVQVYAAMTSHAALDGVLGAYRAAGVPRSAFMDRRRCWSVNSRVARRLTSY